MSATITCAGGGEHRGGARPIPDPAPVTNAIRSDRSTVTVMGSSSHGRPSAPGRYHRAPFAGLPTTAWSALHGRLRSPGMALREYLAEEVARDCAATRLTRREALRRSALMGLSVTAAGALLAACAGNDDTAAKRSGSSGAPPAHQPLPHQFAHDNDVATRETPGTAEAVTFAGSQGTLAERGLRPRFPRVHCS